MNSEEAKKAYKLSRKREIKEIFKRELELFKDEFDTIPGILVIKACATGMLLGTVIGTVAGVIEGVAKAIKEYKY